MLVAMETPNPPPPLDYLPFLRDCSFSRSPPNLFLPAQELIDRVANEPTQWSATQQHLASSGLPLMTEEGEASYGNLKQVVLPLNQVSQHVEATERYIQIATTAERLHGASMYISASSTGQFLKKSEKSNLLELMIVDKATKLNECETLIPSMTLRSFESIWTFQSGRCYSLLRKCSHESDSDNAMFRCSSLRY